MLMNFQSNSVLNALIILLDNGVSSNDLIKLKPNMAHELIEVIGERSTACLVSDLYAKLFRGHRTECTTGIETKLSLDECSILWWSPIIKALESKDGFKKSYINEVIKIKSIQITVILFFINLKLFDFKYFLPRLMRLFPDGINYCQQIAIDSSTLISCTKFSRSLNSNVAVNNSAVDSQDRFLYGNISVTILEKSIINNDDQVRLDSFALLCDNPKTTEAILDVEFELIKKFLYFNSESSYPAFRQSVITSIKKVPEIWY